MGLSNEFLQQLGQKAAQQSAPAPTPAASPASTTATAQPGPGVGSFQPFIDAFRPSSNFGTPPSTGSHIAPVTKPLSQFATKETPVRLHGDISAEEQTRKFGGAVGSPQYWADKEKKAQEHPYWNFLPQKLGNAILGMQFPGMETWDRMTTGDKVSHVAEQVAEAPIKLALGLPAYVLKTIPSLGAVAIRPIVERTLNPEKLAKSEQDHPNIAIDPIYSPAVQAYHDSLDAGHSDGVATVAGLLQGGVEILNRALVGHGLYTATKSLVRPPQSLAPGEGINMRPQDVPVPKPPANPEATPASMYFSHPSTIEGQLRENYGVTGGRLFTKITPAGEGTVQVSVIQTKSPLVSSMKSRIGIGDSSLVSGKLGPEKVLDSHIVKVGEVPIPEGQTPAIRPYPDKPIPGTEMNPVTTEQVNNLSTISTVNGLDPAVKDSLVRMVTGKDAVGELTNAEYIKVAKTLSTMNKAGEFAPGSEASLWTKYMGQHISPAYSWMDAVQRRTGIPLRDMHLDLKDGFRFARTTQDSYFTKLDEIFGDLAGSKGTTERRLIDAHMQGDSAAIMNNPNLTPEAKGKLLEVVHNLAKFYETTGPELGVGPEFFKKNSAGYYAPDIADIGGIEPRYKGDSTVPTQYSFFAKEKKQGGMYPRVDDALKLAQIYVRQGARAKFLDGPLSRIADDPKSGNMTINQNGVEHTIPKEFTNTFRSTVQEMLGYQGKFESFLDDVSGRINKALNRNLPPDLGRRANQAVFSYMYVNGLDSPGTAIRNLFTNEAFLHAKFGSENWFQVQKSVIDPAAWKAFRESGLGGEQGSAYGADLGTIEGGVKNAAQIALKPTSMADDLGRFKAYQHTKFQFEDAVSKYNQGKLTFEQAQKAMGLDSVSPIIADRIRSQLIAGETKKAFEQLAQNNIEETNFPYGRGEGGRPTFGTAGKVATFLYKWNIHAAHMAGNWIRTGQYGNLIRYYAASNAIVQSMKQFNGTDFSNAMYMGPLSMKFPPAVQLGLDIIQGAQKQIDGNDQAINQKQQDIARTLKTFGIPGGVDTANWQNFWRAYSNGPVDEQGRYLVLGPDGRALEKEPVYFSDLFKRLFGLATETKTGSSDLKSQMSDYTYEKSQDSRKVAELRNAGKDAEADKIVNKWAARGENVEPTAAAYEAFDIPQVERQFENLTPAGQMRFAPQFDKPGPGSIGEKAANAFPIQ